MLNSVLISLLIYTLAAGDVQQTNDYTDLICQYDWPCNKAISIARCESSMRPWIIADNNYGLFQINAVHAPRLANNDPRNLLDPQTNVWAAYTLYTERGWQPWIYCGGL